MPDGLLFQLPCGIGGGSADSSKRAHDLRWLSIGIPETTRLARLALSFLTFSAMAIISFKKKGSSRICVYGKGVHACRGGEGGKEVQSRTRYC